MQAIEGFVSVTDTPTGQQNLNIFQIRFVILVFVRDKKKVRRCTHVKSIKTNSNGCRKCQAFHKNLSAVSDTISIGILQYQNPAVARI